MNNMSYVIKDNNIEFKNKMVLPKLLANKLITEFNIDEKIGQGFYASVVKARYVSDESSIVAIKRTKIRAAGEGLIFAAINEIITLNKLKHPGIISYKGTFIDDGSVNVILEFIDGMDLYYFNENFRTELSTIDMIHKYSDIFRKVLDVLVFLQDNNIAHMDIKLENIMYSNINGQGIVKVIDFGHAVPLDSNEVNHALGTLGYHAPELLAKSSLKYIYRKCDVFSYGVTFFSILTNTDPFYRHRVNIAETSMVTSQTTLKYEHKWPKMFFYDKKHKPLCEHIDQALVKNPHARPTAKNLQKFKMF